MMMMGDIQMFKRWLVNIWRSWFGCSSRYLVIQKSEEGRNPIVFHHEFGGEFELMGEKSEWQIFG